MKKILASAFAISLAAAYLTSFTANGIYINWDNNSDDYQEFLTKYVEFDCDSLSDMLDDGAARYYVNTKCYYSPDSDSEYVVVGEKAPVIRILMPKGLSSMEVQSTINEIAPDYSAKWISGSLSAFCDHAADDDIFYEVKCTDSRETAFEVSQRIYQALKGKTEIRRFEFNDGGMCPTFFYTENDSVTDYNYNPEVNGDIGAMLTDFIEKNNLDFTVIIEENADDEKMPMRCKLVPGESVTREEQWAVSRQIGDEFNIGVCFATPLSGKPYGGMCVEMAANIDGDANNDGEIDIADATLILQHIGNADKYPLSIQGAYNADVDGSGDITALDSLTVQKIDAKMY